MRFDITCDLVSSHHVLNTIWYHMRHGVISSSFKCVLVSCAIWFYLIIFKCDLVSYMIWCHLIIYEIRFGIMCDLVSFYHLQNTIQCIRFGIICSWVASISNNIKLLIRSSCLSVIGHIRIFTIISVI